MKNKSKSAFAPITVAVAIVLSALIFTACTDPTDIYDDDDKIINSSVITKVMYSDTRTSSSIKISAKSVTGVDTLFTVKVNNGITVSYDAELSSGRLKIVLCDSENIITLFECTEDSNTASATDEQIDLDAGTYRIRLVGDSANFKINSFSFDCY